MAKLREGPGKVSCLSFSDSAISLLLLGLTLDLGGDSAAGSSDSQAKEDVRGPAHAASAADMEYGTSGYDD